MVDEIKEENLQNSMQPVESLIPENVDQKEHEKNLEPNDENRITMSGPSMRPQPKRELTPEQIKALEQVNKSSLESIKQFAAQKSSRHGWINSNLEQRIKNKLAKDPALRNALFNFFKGGPIAFVSLDPKTQLNITKQVEQYLRKTAKNTANAMQNPTFDPNNMTNPNNPLVQQQQINQNLMDQLNNLDQQNKNAQANQTMNDTALNEQQSETETAGNITAASIFTAEAIDEINQYKEQTYQFNPTPQPSSQKNNDDDKDIKEAVKIPEHLGEETMLKGVMLKDEGMIKDGAKGIEEVAKSFVDHAAMSVGMALMKA